LVSINILLLRVFVHCIADSLIVSSDCTHLLPFWKENKFTETKTKKKACKANKV